MFFVDAECHPQTIDVVRTRAEPIGIDVVVGVPEPDMPAEGVFGVLLQYPGTTGVIRDDRELVDDLHAQGTLVAVAADLLALVLLAPPGEWGADVVVGSAQRFGVPMGYGGPHAGFFATREEYKRNLPGPHRRACRSTPPAAPRCALALQTREQHIRREKATSNICTAQVLLANIAGMYAVYHGPDGLRAIAERVHRHAASAAGTIRGRASNCVHESFFDTVAVRVPDADDVLARARDAWHQPAPHRRRHGRHRARRDHDRATSLRRACAARSVRVDAAHLGTCRGHAREPRAARTSDILTHPVFRTYHSETQMLRYLRKLADRDLALDRTMIPLGSCTMKLNATTEMMPITWPEFADVHPFAPADQAAGYAELFAELEAALCEITGYDAVSLQPNAGSQGELAGLLAIRAYHASRGQAARTVCLIPESAHGTNAASAVMAGHARRRGEVRRRRQRRLRRPEGEGPRARRRPLRADGHVPVDPRRVRERTSATCAPWCTSAAARCTSTAPTSTRSSVSPSRASSAPTCRTSTCTRRSASPTVGEGRASGRWRCASTSPRSCSRHIAGRAARFGRHPADLVRLRRAHGRRRPAPRHRDRRSSTPTTSPPGCAPHYPVLYSGPGGLVAHECILDLRPITQAHRRDRRRRRQASGRLRLPRADAVVPGRGHADGRAHRVRGPRRARPVLRRHDRHPRRDPRRSKRGSGRSTTARCATRRTPPPTSWPPTGRAPTPASRPRSRAARWPSPATSTGRR